MFYQINNNAILLINNLEFYSQIKYINTQVYSIFKIIKQEIVILK